MKKTLERPGRGRPKKDSTMDALSLRVSDELARQIDDYTERVQEELPLLSISRADAIRQLISIGLRHEQKRLGYKDKKQC
jgi:hypothetical protein